MATGTTRFEGAAEKEKAISRQNTEESKKKKKKKKKRADRPRGSHAKKTGGVCEKNKVKELGSSTKQAEEGGPSETPGALGRKGGIKRDKTLEISLRTKGVLTRSSTVLESSL